MKRILMLLSVNVLFACAISSCGPKCKKCHTEFMGVKSPEQEVCGEQLKQVEKTPGMICR